MSLAWGSMKRRRTDPNHVNWTGIITGLGACMFSGIVWYAFILFIISIMRLAGANMTGIWPLK